MTEKPLKEYTVIRGDYLGGRTFELINMVNDYIKIGWEPIGGIAAIDSLNKGVELFQAMMREKK